MCDFPTGTEDYTLSTQQLILQVGPGPPTPACVTVAAVQDSLVEGDHAFDITITSTNHPLVAVGVLNIATITIVDDDGMMTALEIAVYYLLRVLIF